MTMLSMKSVASALVLAASAADLAAPVLVAPAIVLAVSTFAHAGAPDPSVRPQLVAIASGPQMKASQPAHAG